MKGTFLEKVTAEARERAGAARAKGYFQKLTRVAEELVSRRQSHRFRTALLRKEGVNIIAEIKRASPSQGVIKREVDVAQTSRLYSEGGAAAISVLTEPKYFDGAVSDIVTVAKNVDIPVLRKDFIVDEYQIVEAAAAGASAILLIVAALSVDELPELHAIATQFGLDVLVEVHSAAELQTAIDIGAAIIGVNNRDLHTLEVSLDTSRELVKHRPEGVVMVAESGITSREEIDELRELGYDGFLIGETLMRSTDVSDTLRRLSE